MDTLSGCGAAGKNSMTNARKRKHKARVLIASPALPKLKREARRGSPRMRFRAMHPIAMMYDYTRPTWLSEVMVLKAMEEPMMINERRVAKIIASVTALSGISYERKGENGRPQSRAKANSWRDEVVT